MLERNNLLYKPALVQSPLLGFHDSRNELSGRFKQKVSTNVRSITVAAQPLPAVMMGFLLLGSFFEQLHSCPLATYQPDISSFETFSPKDCLWSETNIFFSSLNYRFWLPLLVLFQREKKKATKLFWKGRKTWRKGTTKTQMLNENNVDLLPFSQTLVSASLKTVYIRDLQKNIWLTTWRQLFWDLHEQGFKNICHRIKNVKNWMWREIKKQGCQIIFSRETSNTF